MPQLKHRPLQQMTQPCEPSGGLCGALHTCWYTKGFGAWCPWAAAARTSRENSMLISASLAGLPWALWQAIYDADGVKAM